jgi:ubiquinol-cytochrome c reductase cytochrome b subunit
MGGQKFIRSLTPLNPPEFTKDDIHFNKWLAGFIDGDGYFCLSTHETMNGNREAALEIAQALWNNNILLLLKEKLAGNIYKARGSTNVYYLRKREHLIPLVHRVNGHIRATSRTVQFKALCELLNITYIRPIPLMANDPYLSGFFDADGSLNVASNGQKVESRVQMEVASKYQEDLEVFKKAYNGAIRLLKQSNCYKWVISAKADILFANKCFLGNLRSNKQIRNNLVPLFYDLKDKKAYKIDSHYNGDWNNLIERWYDNGADIYRKDCKGVPYTKKARLEREMKKDLAHKNRDEE